MKKLFVVLGVGLLFASCDSQPNLQTDTITPAALKELQLGHADTLLVVKTNKHNYMKYKYSYFKTDKNHTFEGSIDRYNEYDSLIALAFVVGIVLGLLLVSIIIN